MPDASSAARVLRETAAPSGLRAVPKPRSGSEARQRKHVRATRLDDDEVADLEARASETGLTVGAFLRACALETAGPRARRRAPVDRELLAQTNADLNRVGNNVNQIAYALNSGKEPPSHVGATMDELRGVLAVIRRALGYESAAPDDC
jgi:hypothetical protein